MSRLAAVAAAAVLGFVGAPHPSVAAGVTEEIDDAADLLLPLLDRPLSAGEVVSVDLRADTITLRCQPIPELYLTEITTVIFHIADESMLEGLSPGDKVRFRVERVGGEGTIVRLEHSL